MENTSIVFGFKPKSSPVKYSTLSRFLEDRADIIAAFCLNHIVLHFAEFFYLKF